MLLQRVITAIVLIPLVLLGLFYLSTTAFLLVTGAVILLAAHEWAMLMKLSRLNQVIYLILTSIAMIFASALQIETVLIVSSIWWCIALVLLAIYPKATSVWYERRMISGMIGWLVLIPGWVALNAIRVQATGVYAILFLLGLIWCADIAAYFVGKYAGKHYLHPKVSPKKTWEGFMGGLGLSIGFMTIISLLMHTPLWQWFYLCLLVTVVVIFSVVGDLFESAMKREAGVKDSGFILPGHGGLLDRIDSLTAAIPIFIYTIFLLAKWLAV